MLAIESGHFEAVSDVVRPINVLSHPVVGETLYRGDTSDYGTNICGWEEQEVMW